MLSWDGSCAALSVVTKAPFSHAACQETLENFMNTYYIRYAAHKNAKGESRCISKMNV